MGIFTIKANLRVKAQIRAFGVLGRVQFMKKRFRCLFSINREIMEINRGKLAATV
jgi:hypothetical protein